MATKNKKIIGLTCFLVGFIVIAFWGNLAYKIISLPISGNTAHAKIIGFKVSRYGARMVQNSSSINKFASGRSPFFSFVAANGDSVKTYSNAPQIFVLFNYAIGEDIQVAYPKSEPQKAVIVSWKELPGLFLMIALGFLMLMVGKEQLKF